MSEAVTAETVAAEMVVQVAVARVVVVVLEMERGVGLGVTVVAVVDVVETVDAVVRTADSEVVTAAVVACIGTAATTCLCHCCP